uniref:Uncharacterized protein n=1 Tax=Rhizophora mucronata TaxID=61149 RepID=A0A2P2JN55_RHIMU
MNCILCIPFIIKVNKSITWWPPCNPYTSYNSKFTKLIFELTLRNTGIQVTHIDPRHYVKQYRKILRRTDGRRYVYV